MAKGRLSTVLRYLRHMCQAPPHGDLSDGHLLGRFVTERDEAAFAVLVQRHGALVLGVCRRVLRQEQDAEDACQATFLILARKAPSIRKLESLASWLHGVAQRTALNVRKGVLRRRGYEKPRASPVPQSPVAVAAYKETEAALDAEVQRLPERYRAPFVLCCLEGKSRPEAAKELAWKEGTVSSRLARARHLLQHRLTRRGIALAATLSAALADSTMSSAMSATASDATVKAASLFAVRSASVAAIVSGKVVRLAEGVLQMLLVSKLKKVSIVLATLIALGMVAVAYGMFAGPRPDQQVTAAQPAPQVQDQPKEVDMGLAAKIVVKSKLPLQVIPGEMDSLQAELVLTNQGTKALRLCTFCQHAGGSWAGGGSDWISPDGPWKDSPSPAAFAKNMIVLKPGEKTSFPTGANGVRGFKGKFKFSAGYRISKTFAAKYDSWSGEVKAEVVIPVQETPRKVTADETKLQGTWRITALEFDGEKFGADRPEIKEGKAIITDNVITLKVKKLLAVGGTLDTTNPMVFKLDPATKPKRILLNAFTKEPFRGIYELDGDTLRLCYSPYADAEAPAEFAAPAGSQRWLYSFQRIKTDAPPKAAGD
jgi:RNA polymerase sigma factor (sigma-70 family)